MIYHRFSFFTEAVALSYTETGHERRGEDYVDELAMFRLLRSDNRAFHTACFAAAGRRVAAFYFLFADLLRLWLHEKEVRA